VGVLGGRGAQPHSDVGKHMYSASDMGYRMVRDSGDEDAVLVCPAFERVGKCIGGIDIVLLPVRCVSRLMDVRSAITCCGAGHMHRT